MTRLASRRAQARRATGDFRAKMVRGGNTIFARDREI